MHAEEGIMDLCQQWFDFENRSKDAMGKPKFLPKTSAHPSPPTKKLLPGNILYSSRLQLSNSTVIDLLMGRLGPEVHGS